MNPFLLCFPNIFPIKKIRSVNELKLLVSIIEYTFKDHLIQPPCNEQGHLQLDQFDPFNLTLNVSRDGASATSLRNLFLCFINLIVKNFLYPL